jgi:hypothetical protein
MTITGGRPAAAISLKNSVTHTELRKLGNSACVTEF